MRLISPNFDTIQSRNYFTKVLKQVCDLSDEDNDSMLSLREFCVALYLMERYREGRSLPTVHPHSFIVDETLFPAPGQLTAAHGIPSWRPSPGFQQPQATKNARSFLFPILMSMFNKKLKYQSWRIIF